MAPKNEIRLELLLGRRVYAPGGAVVGRLQEFRAEREGDGWIVTGFDIGPAALLERFAANHLGLRRVARLTGYLARWDQLDLTDPERPVLCCNVDELTRLR